LDADGGPTTDSAAALLGPLLPFGGVGSNVAVVVELLTLLFGASPPDAPESASGEQLPRVVLFLPALERAVLGADHLYRVEDHLDRLPAGDGIAVGRHLSPVAPVVLPEHLVARPEGGGPSRA
jgi:LDH2 family malate/lactate/ureidoglycolate dehydrogenase